ncbi:hypothetical protein MERGE_001249 [Pneumocystis wakefieldiae]|uniref:Uncharacterized protein n=1 Tax=Pneumocystis wakefieldiae TaxID=38082 RepID=A0A899G403_9ASCO|nr:hypothetical protein MERGE_001249 [Pneumocystis wakefieldiae]
MRVVCALYAVLHQNLYIMLKRKMVEWEISILWVKRLVPFYGIACFIVSVLDIIRSLAFNTLSILEFFAGIDILDFKRSKYELFKLDELHKNYDQYLKYFLEPELDSWPLAYETSLLIQSSFQDMLEFEENMM